VPINHDTALPSFIGVSRGLVSFWSTALYHKTVDEAHSLVNFSNGVLQEAQPSEFKQF
jgi:hypothetical protein